PSSEVSSRAMYVADGEDAPTPTVEDEPMASTLTLRLPRTARLKARSGLRKRSPAMRLVLQSGDSAGGAAGKTTAGRPASASSCGTAAIGAKAMAHARAQGNTRISMKSPQPLPPGAQTLGQECL